MKTGTKSGAAALIVLLALGTTVACTGTARADWGGHRDRDARRVHWDHDRARFRHHSHHYYGHSREVIVVHPRAHRYYDHHRGDAAAYRWFALTATTLAIIDRLDRPQPRTVIVPAGERVIWVPAAPARR